MTENKEPDNRQIKMGDGSNYNESIERDYIQGNAYYICNYYYREDVRGTPVKPADASGEDSLPCPYRGLFHFGPNDAEFFFGREVYVEQLVEATQTRNFIPVLGASGSGKSSVVLAGLVPRLQQQGNWKFTHFRPGSDPFYALAEALVPLYKSDLDSTDEIIQAGKLAQSLKDRQPLFHVFSYIQRKHPNHRVLLIADQFEELYTLCNDKKIHRDFLNCLLTIIPSDANKFSFPTVLVATMRADFLGSALEYRPFADVLHDDIKLGPMNRTELLQVIEKPTQKLGVRLEAGLVERILDDVENEPGNLPLLEFALTLLWEHRSDRQLTHAAYEAIGEVQGALAAHADEIIYKLDATEQQQVRRIFMQLIRLGEGTEDTRRIATKSELGAASWLRVSQLADARLVVTSRNSSGQETVEVVHEALIRHWQLLQGWIDENRSKIIQKNRIERWATEWQQNKQLNDYLLQKKRLKEAKAFQKKELTNFALSDLACKFINKSIKHERRRTLKTASFLAIPLLIAFVVVDPLIRGTNEQEAWKIIKDPKNAGVRAAIELLTQGCWARTYQDWMPDFPVISLFGNCANLRYTNLSSANLSFAHLGYANLRYTNLSYTNLSSAGLIFADLSHADLTGADLRGASLQYAELIFADLSYADLSHADLTGADLSYADLRGANFSDPKYKNSDKITKLISNAKFGCDKFLTKKPICTNLKKVKNLTSQQIKDVNNWEQACYDPELRKQLNLPPENPNNCASKEEFVLYQDFVNDVLDPLCRRIGVICRKTSEE